MFDRDGNKVILAGEPNMHQLNLGQSGTGKTHHAVRTMEELLDNGKRALVIDYSSSFSQEELSRHGAQFLSHIMDPMHDIVYFDLEAVNLELAADQIAAAIIHAFGIHGYKLERMVEDACAAMIGSDKAFSFLKLVTMLEEAYDNGDTVSRQERQETQKTLERLLNRLRVTKALGSFIVRFADTEIPSGNHVDILQLSNVSPVVRSQFVNFCLSLLWENVRAGKGSPMYDAILLDEIQNLEISNDSTLYQLLREGRKFGIQLILCTQYLSGYKPNEREALMQAGTILFFRPTKGDLAWISKLLEQETQYPWAKTLATLPRGYAVLKGNYYLNNSKRMSAVPLIVHSTTNAS